MKKAFCVGIMLMLSGCQVYSLEELRHATPTGNEFQQALAKEYLQLAAQEEQNYNWQNSWHFADKGLSAAYGNDIGPENVSDWGIDGEAKVEMEKARDDLLTALRPDVVSANPVVAARAYRYFDCWVERQGEGWQANKIAECKQGFEDNLAELKISKSAPSAPTSADAVDTTSYIVFFEWNSASVSKSGEKVISGVIDSLSGESGYEIVLNGHTDTTGLEKFNLLLSRKRAEAVARRLEKGGIAKDAIKIFAFGESDPKVPTADGVDEPKNRRVEIFIQ